MTSRPLRIALTLLLSLAGSLPAARAAAAGAPASTPPKTAAAATAPLPMATLKPFAANYQVRINGVPFKATASQTLTALGGDRWRLELTLNSFVLDTTERSDFRWDGATCNAIPGEYQYTRKSIGNNRQWHLLFDQVRHVARGDNGKRVTVFAITDHTQDKLGHALALACQTARGARGTIGIDVAWDHKVEHFEYAVSPTEETISTPAGNWKVLRIERKRVGSDRMTRSWIAAAADWQPVQMQHIETRGTLLQLQLLKLERRQP